MGNDDELLSLISAELARDIEEQPQPAGKAGILYFGTDEKVRARIKEQLEGNYEMFYSEDIKQIPKFLKQISALILDPSCSTFSLGINLTKKLKEDFQQIKVFHIIRNITNEYGVYMNNYPFQVPDFAAEIDQIPDLIKYIRTNLQ